MRWLFANGRCIVAVVFWVAAVASSLFHGFHCWTIHELDLEPKLSELTRRWKSPWKKLRDEGVWAWKAHQVFLNFCGSIFGWAAFWYLACDYLGRRLGTPDLALAIVAFLGMTGLIPRVSRYGSPLYPKS